LIRVEVPAHDVLKARSFLQFSGITLRTMAWPAIHYMWLIVVLQLPGCFLLWRLLRDGVSLTKPERLAVAIVILGTLHAMAVAYSRGRNLPDGLPLSRYCDPLLPGFVAQGFALFMLSTHARWRWTRLIWSGAALVGLLTLTTTNLALHLPLKALQNRERAQALTAYLKSGDAQILEMSHPVLRIHPAPSVVVQALENPHLRKALEPVLADVMLEARRISLVHSKEAAPADSRAPTP
jgi:hypothetical protein